MILGFHYHTPFVKKDGKYYVQSFIGLFLDTLSVHTDEIKCFLHSAVPHEEYLCDYEITSPKVKIFSLGPHTSVIRRWVEQNKLVAPYKNELKSCDKFLVRIPTPMIRVFSRYFKANQLITYKVGDYLTGMKGNQGSFIRRTALALWTLVYHGEELKAIRNSKFTTNSQEYLDKFKSRVKNTRLVRTTTFFKDAIYHREDSFTGDKIILLYTGRLVLDKGIIEIMEALKVLREKGYNIVFHLVGWDPSKGEKSLAVIKERMNELGIADYVSFFPKQPVGEKLFRFYKEASIFLSCSTSTEGFPRTVWEAMANGLPVISTTVGSVPYYLKDGEDAVLIGPTELDKLPEKIEFLIKNETNRKKIIANAYKLVEDNTLESQSKKLIDYINE